MSDPDLLNAINLLTVEIERFNTALYSIGTDQLLVRSTALASPQSVDDWSATVAQMQLTRDPFPAGAPALAADLAEELESLRYMIQQISGEAQWYIDVDIALDQFQVGTATGDILVWNNANLAWERLARGAVGQLLTATALTIAWAAAPAPPAGIPTNGVIAWYGTDAGCPEDWTICDGRVRPDGSDPANTPDLSASFIKGAAVDGDVGDTGGAATHQHTAPSGSDGGWNHFTARPWGTENNNVSRWEHEVAWRYGANKPYSKTKLASSEPVYYRLYWIMRD